MNNKINRVMSFLILGLAFAAMIFETGMLFIHGRNRQTKSSVIQL